MPEHYRKTHHLASHLDIATTTYFCYYASAYEYPFAVSRTLSDDSTNNDAGPTASKNELCKYTFLGTQKEMSGAPRLAKTDLRPHSPDAQPSFA